MPSTQRLLKEGVSDAVGFIGGALSGFWLGQALGLDVFSTGYDSASMIAIALVGLGGGLGLHLARRWQQRQNPKASDDA